MTSDTGGGFVHSVGATEGANEKTVAAFGRFHRSEFESNATRRSRCNLGEVERVRIDSVGTPQGVATRLPTCRCLDLKARNRTLGAHFGHQELSPCEVFAQSNFTGHALRRAPDCVAES